MLCLRFFSFLTLLAGVPSILGMKDFLRGVRDIANEIENQGFWKHEVLIQGPQDAEILVDGESWLNFCANNYLGLANNEKIVAAAQAGLEAYGFGMSSVRFICGTQDQHRLLESEIAEFLGTEDAILYSSCFDANAGLFEALLGERDAIVSDELNHASLIDGIRLCKAGRYRYKNRDLEDLRSKLADARRAGARWIFVVSDGVFSMDGTVAPLADMRRLADEFEAVLVVDDSHAVGFYGPGGRGTPAAAGVRADILTGTLGKALGGASGGYTAGPREVIAVLRQRSRPYLFSNALAPPIVAASRAALKLVEESSTAREDLEARAVALRRGLANLGYRIPESDHPIVPVIVGDAASASKLSGSLAEKQILAVAFSFPVVPKGKARIRLQVTARHSPDHIRRTIDAFAAARGFLEPDAFL